MENLQSFPQAVEHSYKISIDCLCPVLLLRGRSTPIYRVKTGWIVCPNTNVKDLDSFTIIFFFQLFIDLRGTSQFKENFRF